MLYPHIELNLVCSSHCCRGSPIATTWVQPRPYGASAKENGAAVCRRVTAVLGQAWTRPLLAFSAVCPILLPRGSTRYGQRPKLGDSSENTSWGNRSLATMTLEKKKKISTPANRTGASEWVYWREAPHPQSEKDRLQTGYYVEYPGRMREDGDANGRQAGGCSAFRIDRPPCWLMTTCARQSNENKRVTSDGMTSL